MQPGLRSHLDMRVNKSRIAVDTRTTPYFEITFYPKHANLTIHSYIVIGEKHGLTRNRSRIRASIR